MPTVVALRFDAAEVRPTAAQLQAVVSRWLDSDENHRHPVKPYTISRRAQQGEFVEVAVSLLDDSLLPRFVEEVSTTRELRLGPVTTSPSPWPDGSAVALRRREDWAELLDASAATREFEFEFLSPTAFRSGRVVDPIPVPTKVFGHLRHRWQSFAPDSLQPHIDLRECGLGTVHLSGKTDHARAFEKKWVGFVGTARYRAWDGDERAWRVLDVLARLAPYAGVGTSTTFGMGRTEYRPAQRRKQRADS
jgi:CRISPR-associated endoribonuclease Cas6